MAITQKFFNNSGTFPITFPMDVTNVQVEGFGAGGAGANRNANGVGGGGAGGAYAKLNAFHPVVGTTYSLTVGTPGNTNNNSNGTDTTFNSTTLVAKGGNTANRNNATGQTAFAVGSSTGDVVNKGGNGATGITAGGNNGGGGGSSGGNNGAGVDASGNLGGGQPGTSTAPGGAGIGGNGAKSTSANGNNGVFPGGAGGGSTRNNATNRQGGNGANGQVIFSYWSACTLDQHQDSEGANFGFGQGAASVASRGQCFTPTITGQICVIGWSRNLGAQGLRIFFDTASANIPDHTDANALYAFEVANANITGGFQEVALPGHMHVTAGTQYCFYMYPWSVGGSEVYTDDYQDVHGVSSGSLEITAATVNSWSNENLTWHYSIWVMPDIVGKDISNLQNTFGMVNMGNVGRTNTY